MIKWLPADGSVQRSKCGRYCIVKANSQHWIPYRIHGVHFTDLHEKTSEEGAKAACESHAGVKAA